MENVKAFIKSTAGIITGASVLLIATVVTIVLIHRRKSGKKFKWAFWKKN